MLGIGEWNMICPECAAEHNFKPIGLAPAKQCALCLKPAHSPHPVRRPQFEQMQRDRKAKA
jgi:hypothetical protein